jgi:hypothetical protein
VISLNPVLNIDFTLDSVLSHFLHSGTRQVSVVEDLGSKLNLF